MRLAIVWTILRKELVESLRDRRTLVRLVVVPLLLYPLFALAMSKLVGFEAAAREARPSRIAVWGELAEGLETKLSAAGKIELAPWAGAPPDVREGLLSGALAPPAEPAPALDDGEAAPPEAEAEPPRWIEPENPVLAAARAAVSERKVDAVLVPWPSMGAELGRGGKGAVAIYFDSVRADSATAEARLEGALQRARRAIVADREAERGLPEGFSRAFDVVPRDVAADSRKVGQILGAMMPMLLILMSLLGSFLPAIDLTAGEKERGTMQTLLCAPVRPIEIISGKFLAVWVISLLTALGNVVSMSLTVSRLLPDAMVVGPGTFALTFVLLVPVTLLFSALFLALAVFAKDFKDGQNALMPAYLPLSLLAGITALPVVELNPWTAYAPVLNIAVLIKALFVGEAPADLLFTALVSSALYACLALLFAARVFERESVLLGGHESARAVLGLGRRAGGAPSAGFSLAAFAGVQVLFFYGSLLIARTSVAVQLAVSQVGFFLVPTLALVAGFGYSPRATLGLRPASVRGLAGALLLGVAAWAAIGGTVLRWFPAPEPFARELGELVLLGGQPYPVVLLLVAVTPAVCEELLFRGLVYAGLRRAGPAVAIGGSALLFGLAHGSVYRLLPTFSLGLALGYARHRTGSVLPGALLHALNNGLAVSLLYFKPSWAQGLLEGEVLPWSVTFAGMVVSLAGLLLLRFSAPSAPEPEPEGKAKMEARDRRGAGASGDGGGHD
ncbi:ABC transporter permease subunit/CPBP intramembrane protease [Sorangium sp. So ce448]|uniref:ABC transporter permease subunit/CPBP intramembrane protease n=1 Tax=Sorangium sp. So ce448 TaxID=3133314 RepID=UPI003F5E2F09